MISNKNVDGGWGYKLENFSDTLDTALALQALKAANYSDTTVLYQAINFLTSNQNANGGWGFIPSTGSGQIPGNESNTYVTAMVLRALNGYSSTFSVQSPIGNAATFLLAKQTQNNDGGFGSSPSTVYETALSVMALIESGQGSTQQLQNGINYLITAQSTTNGSWNDDPYQTALALQALASARANLTASSLSFSKAMPQDGENVTITATINNRGLEDASNVIVRFYSGDPATGGTQISTDQLIPSLTPNSSTPVSVTSSFTGTGSRTIFVVVDPDSLISETSKLDNKTSSRIWIATGPDLAVYSDDLKPSTYVPATGTAFTLEYKVRNLGETAADAFTVSLYDGDPSTGSGQLLQTANISGLNGTETRTNTIGVTLTGDGAHTLYLMADAGSTIQEISETNNTGAVTVTVGGTQTGADLVVTPMDITAAPDRPTTGQSVAISARVRNQGADAAFGFLVELYDGSPEAGGTLIKSETISLAAGGEQIVSANWTASSGIHDIYVIVDRSNGIVESDENNNRASMRIMPDMQDITISANDLTFTPAHPVMGDSVVLTIIAYNTGIVQTGSFNLALYDGDPAAGGTLLNTYAVSSIQGDGSVTLTYTFTAEPKTYQFTAVADTENVVTEMYEANNLAVRSLRIKAPGEVLGPDLVPIKIDLDSMTTGTNLAVSGTAYVTFQNKGDDKITTSFNVLIFEDKDNDGRYTASVDNLLGTGEMVTGPTTSIPAIWPEGAGMVSVPLSGTVKFLHSPLYAMIDSGDAILEQDETNNLLISCKDCEVRPANPIQPVVNWTWQHDSYYNGNTLSSTPVVANLTDTNGDGKIDKNDVPNIIFVGFGQVGGIGTGMDYYGKLWVLRGDTGATVYTVMDLAHPFLMIAQPAVGDIDNDGLPEIVIPKAEINDHNGLVVYNHDGTLKWDNKDRVKAWNMGHPNGRVTVSAWTTPVIADIDGNGVPEIVVGASVINNDGSVKWGWLPEAKCWSIYSQNGNGTGSGLHRSMVADIDFDGMQEIIAGNTVYDYNGSVKWCNTSVADGINAVGNLDDDPYPEIVLIEQTTGVKVSLLEHDGKRKWGPVSVLPGYGAYEMPIIADLDGDGEAEIGIKIVGGYTFLDKDGKIKKILSVPSWYGSFADGTVFDLNGDSRPEVIVNSDVYFKIFDGKSGSLLFQDAFGNGSGSLLQSVVVADVNGDGHAEIVAAGRSSTNWYKEELRVYKSSSNDWVNTRKIWNQASYHVTNVNDDGTIPQNEAPSWLLNNTFRCQAPIGQSPNPYLTPNLTASYLRAAQNSSGLHFTVRIGNGGAKEAASGVVVTFYDGNPSSGGTVIGTAATKKALQIGEYEDISMSWTGGSAGLHDIYAVVNGTNSVSECRSDDNQAMLSLTVPGSGTLFGPDLVPLRIDLSSMNTNTQTLAISGTARITLQNKGDAAVATGFAVTIFADVDNDGRYTQGVDTVLGESTNTMTLAPNGATIVEAPISGTVAFLSAPLSVMVDPLDEVKEQNEDNNILRSGSNCEVRPIGTIQPVVKMNKTSDVWPNDVVIANLNGKNDTSGIPAIIYTAQTYGDRLVAVNGKTGSTIFDIPLSNIGYHGSSFAVGDVNGDGYPEIILSPVSYNYQVRDRMLLFDHNGNLIWDNAAQISAWNSAHASLKVRLEYNFPVEIADIDGDGHPEIISGPTVVNPDGSVKWVGDYWGVPITSQGGWDRPSIVVDLDLDGKQEVLTGNSAYNYDGTTKWRNSDVLDGSLAIGNFDNDQYPEIVLAYLDNRSGPNANTETVLLLEHDGQIKWGPVNLNKFYSTCTGCRTTNPLPVVADFDGDGVPEIGIRVYDHYLILDKNGNLKKNIYLTVGPYAPWGNTPNTAPAVFDIDGDGASEILMNGDGYFKIISGKTGAVLYQEDWMSASYGQGVVVGDVDGDSHAEVVISGTGYYPHTLGNHTSVRVYGSANNNWVNARKVWNQASYHVTNVNEDGTIPQYEAPSWLVNNTYRCQASTGLASSSTGTSYATPNLTASYFRVAFDGSDLNLLVRVGNSGASDAPAGTVVTFYDGTPANETIVGTVSIPNALSPGEYADVAFSISNAVQGVHHLYAVADSDGVVSECNENDNQAQVDYTVQYGNPDLTIGSEDISLPTGTSTEGSIIPVTVNVRNIGAVSASNVFVRLYNGNPSSGGTQVGSDQSISVINEGGSSTLVFNYDTLGRSGANVLYVAADPANSLQETNETNNTAPVSLDVQPPVLPDLAVTVNDVQLAPASALEGDSVLITATILNRGTQVGEIPVTITVASAAGAVYSDTKTIYPILTLGQSATVQTVFNTTGSAGQYAVSISVDPANAIVESREDNNTASGSLFIQSSAISSGMALNKTAYQANDDVVSTITATNVTAATRTLTMDLFVKDSAGNTIATIAQAMPVIVGPNSSVTLAKTWNTGNTLAADYILSVEFKEGNLIVSRSSAAFTIAADKSIGAKVTVDKVSYKSNETVAITSTITSQSGNFIFENMSAKITVARGMGPGAGEELYAETKSIKTLMPGAIYTFKTYWNTSTYAPGTYPVTLEVKDATGAVIASGAQTITIASNLNPSALLKGQITVDNQSLLSGETVTVAYSVTNTGNIDLANVNLSVLTVHVVNQTIYGTLTSQATVSMGGTYTGSGQINTQTYSAKDYLVILQAEIGGVTETLAGTYFRVEGAPSAPSLASPAMNVDVETFTPTLSINNASDPNDDKLTYEFEVYADSGMINLVGGGRMEAGGNTITSWTVPMNLQENATYYWRARAYDNKLYGDWMQAASFRVNTINDLPTAPITTSPADNASVDTLLPILAVTNATDPDSVSLTYNFTVALDPDFISIVTSTLGVASGQGTTPAFAGAGSTSWQVPVNLVENSTYYWRCQADDWLDVGPWSTASRFFVNTSNDAPSIPVIISPLNNAVVTMLSTDITVSNSTDPDSPVISYFFELDKVLTFDSLERVQSGSIPQAQDTTTWHLDGLQENTQYYVRAKASDGSADSVWSTVVSFFANTTNDPPTTPVPANPSNGAGASVFTPTLSVHNASDPDKDALTYEFEVYADSGMINPVGGGRSEAGGNGITAWTVPISLNENQTYYWRARAYDGALYSDWTPTWSFMVNTANDAPGAPALSSPQDGSSVATLTPTLAITNAVDPDSDTLTYGFEVYKVGALAASITNVPQDSSGITAVTLTTSLSDNTVYEWRCRAFDGDRYGPWMSNAAFTVHIPQTSINATIDFDPDTLNKASNGTWVVVYIEFPAGYKPADVDVSTVRLEGSIPAELRPAAVGDHDKDGIPDLMVKFKRSDVISLLPNGEQIAVHVSGKVGAMTFDGVDVIRVMQ